MPRTGPHLVAVLVPLDHFWGQVVQGAAERAPAVAGGVHGPPEVRDLQLVARPQKQVLGLDVAVDNVTGVAVRQGLAQLRDVRRRNLLVEVTLPLQLDVQLSLGQERGGGCGRPTLLPTLSTEAHGAGYRRSRGGLSVIGVTACGCRVPPAPRTPG